LPGIVGGSESKAIKYPMNYYDYPCRWVCPEDTSTNILNDIKLLNYNIKKSNTVVDLKKLSKIS
jgi:hypothetical protein